MTISHLSGILSHAFYSKEDKTIILKFFYKVEGFTALENDVAIIVIQYQKTIFTDRMNK